MSAGEDVRCSGLTGANQRCLARLASESAKSQRQQSCHTRRSTLPTGWTSRPSTDGLGLSLPSVSQDSSNTDVRRPKGSAVLPLSSRFLHLRSFVPGLTFFATPLPSGQPTSWAASSSLSATNTAASAQPPATSSSSTAAANTDTSAAPSQRRANVHGPTHADHPTASSGLHGSSRLHLHPLPPHHSSRAIRLFFPKRTRHYHHTAHPQLQPPDRYQLPSAHSAAAAPLRHPTLRLISSRIRAGSKSGARADGARLGLVVEGGGMRGCISGAMLMALHDLGLTDVFDAVYGASAGAINATYFLSGQRDGLQIYAEDLTQGTAFLDFRNLFSGSSRPVMNIDFLIDQVMAVSKPLDWDAVLASPTPLKVVASCLDSLRPVLLSDFVDRAELAEALKASAAVPQIAGPPRRLRGRTLVDAAVFEPVPVQSAIRDGCSHVLVLCTRPAPTRRSPWARRVRSTIEAMAKTTVLNVPYMRDAWRAASSEPICSPAWQDERLLAALYGCPHAFRASEGAFVMPLYPDHTAGCHPLCLDPDTLAAACEVGHSALLRLLGPVVACAAQGAQDAEEEDVAAGVKGLAAVEWELASGSGKGGDGNGGIDGDGVRGHLVVQSCTQQIWTCGSGREEGSRARQVGHD